MIDSLLNEIRVEPLITALAKKLTYGKISVVLWSNLPNHAFLEKLYQLAIWNGISMVLPFNDYIDIFSFASSIKDTKMNNFYLNHLHLIKRFIVFFRLKGKKTIELASRNLHSFVEKIELYSHSHLSKEKITVLQSLREIVPPRKTFIKTECVKKIALNKKETEYLMLLLEGKSVRAISEELHISKRSVESCLESIKVKTGYRTKTKLLSAFLESLIYQPSINYDRHY